MNEETTQSGKPMPQWMIVYWCPHCEIDSGRTEIDGPLCFMCERTEGLTELSREPMSPEAIAKRLKASADRMMENLRKAHDIAEEDWPKDDETELKLLEALAMGKDLQEELTKIAQGMTEADEGK